MIILLGYKVVNPRPGPREFIPVITLVIIPDLFYSQARIRFLIDRRFEIRRFGELWLQFDIFTVIYYTEEVSLIQTNRKSLERNGNSASDWPRCQMGL